MGLLSKLVKTGVGAGAEYREHRREVKHSRETSAQSVEQRSQQDADQFLDRSSGSARPSRHAATAGPADAPPAYTDNPSRDATLLLGGPAAGEKKVALAQYDDEDSSDDDLSTEDDEADWQLDEALDRNDITTPEEPPEYRPIDTLVQDVMQTSTRPANLPADFDITPLPCPVIIPQRRPRKKGRGFVHAYAPLLGECSGLSQETFISFLENFHRSSQASPVWTVIMVSASIAGLAPSVIAMAVTNAVQIAAGTAQELQTRQRTNNFLEKMNEELFKPRGLFAMIVKYKTDEEVKRSENSIFAKLGVGAQKVDFSTGQAVAKYDRSLSKESAGGKDKSMSDRMKDIRLASGTTRGTVEMPEAAPLVFPALDKVIVNEGPETFKDKAKDAKAFMADYLDRRAQMEYNQQDPNSALGVPEDKRTMKSQYSDPNHPMYNSGLVGLVSGGKLGGHRSRSYGYDTAGRRPNLYDSSRLYSSSDVSRRDVRRHNKHERRALKTEQRIADGRHVSRKRERRYEGFLQDQERMYGGDAGFGVGGGRRGLGRGRGGGPLGMLLNAAGASMQGGQQTQGSASAVSTSTQATGEQSYGVSPATSDPARMQRRPRKQKGGALGMVKRVMQEDVLYLMIVNMPSEAELAEAREAIAAAKAAK